MEESCVTIFIQGHGNQLMDEIDNVSGNVKLLSFSGYATCAGKMEICNDKSVDMLALETIKKEYQNKQSCNDQNFVYKNISPILIKKYKECGVTYPNDGFRQTWPKYDRMFQLHPGKGEDPKLCPEYGITVVASSYPSDLEYTLLNKGNKTANLNILGPTNYAAHWRQQALKYNSQYEKEINEIYTKINNKFLYLSDLIFYFQMMGFKKIIILDPTCRDNADLSQEQVALITEKETSRAEFMDRRATPAVRRSITKLKLGTVYKPTPEGTSEENCIERCINGICSCFKQKKNGGSRKRYKPNKHMKKPKTKTKKHIKKPKTKTKTKKHIKKTKTNKS